MCVWGGASGASFFILQVRVGVMRVGVCVGGCGVVVFVQGWAPTLRAVLCCVPAEFFCGFRPKPAHTLCPPLPVPVAQLNRGAVDAAFAGGAEVDEDGIEDAFELVAEVPEKIR